ncbi:MAG: hypothetical protein CVU51_10235 [Deltaproteobacteria bacterium HGW-Deltaproteobacteria-1]|nr:MAG: hypothetical protein CVU51_10235 [Deltaproteobacteria bacterium HGW-Deltaproteobacteria-1]
MVSFFLKIFIILYISVPIGDDFSFAGYLKLFAGNVNDNYREGRHFCRKVGKDWYFVISLLLLRLIFFKNRKPDIYCRKINVTKHRREMSILIIYLLYQTLIYFMEILAQHLLYN